MYKLFAGRTIIKGGKDLFYISRSNDGHNNFNISPTKADAMAHFIIDALNKGDFDAYYKKYMSN